MMISEAMKMKIIKVPFPLAVDGEPMADGALGIHQRCISTCLARECMNTSLGEGRRTCDQGLRYHVYRVRDQFISVYGLAPLESGVPKRRDLKGRGYPPAAVHSWIVELNELLQTFEKEAARSRAEALDSLHDISRMAMEVSSIAEKVIERAGGIERAGDLELSLLKASELLVGEFDRIELLINPVSAASGRRYTHVYKLCHKIVQILDIALCKPRNKKIRMTGRSDMTLKLYESVSTLVFAVIENAAKYAFPSGDAISVEVVDSAGSVEISVVSVGPLIEPTEIERVFDKGFRGRWAKGSVEGRGVGLYLAQLVASAHRTKIVVESISLGYGRDSIPVARNRFSVRLREV